MKVLVIPSNRADRLKEFFDAWLGVADWDVAIVVWDSDAPPRYLPAQVYSRAAIQDRLHHDHWIISRGDSACRAFGFLLAADLGADWILTLDDDCLPIEGATSICAAHLAAMRSHSICQPTAGMRTRGLPYRNLGAIESRLNMGLWRNVADVDGPTGLTPQPYFTPPPGTRLAHPCCRYPICGMNLFFSVDLLPALYFPLMGDGQPYRRFDDIWCGWIFQRVAEHLRIHWSFGEPHLEHVRASDPFSNLEKEAPGIRPNETLWERINAIELTAPDLAGTVEQIAASLACDADEYLARLGVALSKWNHHAQGAVRSKVTSPSSRAFSSAKTAQA